MNMHRAHRATCPATIDLDGEGEWCCSLAEDHEGPHATLGEGDAVMCTWATPHIACPACEEARAAMNAAYATWTEAEENWRHTATTEGLAVVEALEDKLADAERLLDEAHHVHAIVAG